MPSRFFALWLILVLVADAPCLRSEEKAPVAAESAELQGALKIFKDRCVECHAGRKPKGNLDLSTVEAVSKGTRRGPVIVPGKVSDSLLWEMIQNDKMPPKKPLPETERAVLKQWIEKGAPGLPAYKSRHWAFQLPVKPPVPEIKDKEHARTDIDRFVIAQLEKKKLTLGAEADRVTLIRRVSFDLTGLPPTLSEIDAFLVDKSADAHEKMVERYLASPRYGERWGKYWLDVAGYADSNGYFSADSDRLLAYRYRDYVIRAFNQDKPFDRFVREQLAGDEMAGYVAGGDVTPEMVELLTATHFLRNAPDGSGESDGNPDEVRTDRFTVLEGNLQIAMNSLLGITIQCTRCHSHKFEPISHEEYYSLQAILYPAYCPDRWANPNDRVVAVASKAKREEYERRTGQIDKQIKALEESLTKIAKAFREQLIEDRLTDLEPAAKRAVLEALTVAEDKRNAEQKALLQKHVEPLKIGEEEIAKRFPEYQAVREKIQKAVDARKKERPVALEKLAVLVETDAKPPAHHLLIRGQHNSPGKEVQPGVPAALSLAGNAFQADPPIKDRISTGRRSAFACWVTSAKNPLFARVMVNRIWQHHFGVGLVATPDNLGQSGAKPSHPQLLDYLATEFVRSGYSVKAMHRLILQSAVYRQTSTLREEAYEIDPDNRLLWRYPLRRLDAEALRDALLATAGELDLREGGPFVPTHRTDDGSVVVDEKQDGARRRSVYLQQRRTQVLTLMELFDAPSIVANCSNRNSSTVPLQSLALLNSDFARLRSVAFAKRLAKEAEGGDLKRIALAFRLACGRNPTEDEQAACGRFLKNQRTLYEKEKDGEDKTWTDFCQMILASNAFLYVE